MPWVDTWVGGRVWRDQAGRRTFIIRKSMRGKRWEVSTRCSTERAAIKALERFEHDPEGFQAGEDVIADSLALDEKLVDQFIAYSRDVKGNTPRWCDVQKRLLDWWRKQLAGKNLKRLDLGRDVIPHLDGVRELKNRIATLKALFGWLRKVRHLITSNQDCSRDLSVPQAKPAQATRSKVISVKDEERLLAALPHEWAVRGLLLSKTGMHLTELESFVNGGRVEQRGDDWVLVLPHTKRGPEHRIVISTAGVEVAKEALTLGKFSVNQMAHVYRRFSKNLGIDGWGPGMWRHTFATRLVEEGATPESVSLYLNHRSVQTTLKFYAALAVAPKPKPARRSRNPSTAKMFEKMRSAEVPEEPRLGRAVRRRADVAHGHRKT